MRLAQMLISLLRTKLIAILLILLPQLSYAAAIGNVVLQEGVTSVERKGTESDLNLDSDIMFMDNVKTGKGEVGITFIDDTNVAVSSQSSLIIDDFVYDPNSAKGSKLVLKIALGTVRYASGNIAKLSKQNVDIRTPTARIGVRGTAFSMTVDEIGQSLIILLPNADGSVGEISVESDIGQVILTRAFQATSVRSSLATPTKPKILDLTESMINNMLIIKPPKEKVDVAVAEVEDKKKKNVLDFNELDENQLDRQGCNHEHDFDLGSCPEDRSQHLEVRSQHLGVRILARNPVLRSKSTFGGQDLSAKSCPRDNISLTQVRTKSESGFRPEMKC